MQVLVQLTNLIMMPIFLLHLVAMLFLTLHLSKDRFAAAEQSSCILSGVNDSSNCIIPDKLPSNLPEDAGIVSPPTCASVINFDDFVAPGSFFETTRLTSRYQAMGVIFEGPGSNDGGAILDVIAGNFFVTGQSGNNALAFNLNAFLSDGGIPRGPERILFDPAIEYVQVNAGEGGSLGSSQVMLECFDDSNNSVGVSIVTSDAALQTMAVTGSTITSCAVSFTGQTLVVDDLAFCPATPAPTPTPTPQQCVKEGQECLEGGPVGDGFKCVCECDGKSS